MPFEYVLYDLSYVNLVLYGSVLPRYNPKKVDKKDEEEVRADDPQNREKVLKFLQQIE